MQQQQQQQRQQQQRQQQQRLLSYISNLKKNKKNGKRGASEAFRGSHSDLAIERTCTFMQHGVVSSRVESSRCVLLNINEVIKTTSSFEIARNASELLTTHENKLRSSCAPLASRQPKHNTKQQKLIYEQGTQLTERKTTKKLREKQNKKSLNKKQ